MRDRVYIWDDAEKRLVPAWSDRGPGYARASGHSGELVVGTSERDRELFRQRAAMKALRERRTAA